MAQPVSRSLWHLIESVVVAMAQGYGLARVRALSHPSAMIRMLAQRDHLHSEASLLEREVAIFRAQRLAKVPRRRAQFAPEQRAEILQLIALRGWSAKFAASRFGLHPNTIRNWKRLLRDKHKSERRFGEPPWNRLHDAVRWTVREIRRLCPEREFGTRTIARHMLRAGIQISRASVRRILEEERSRSNRARRALATPPARDRSLRHLMDPCLPHTVWHIDLTELRVLWCRFEVAAVLDGYSRKLLVLRVFHHRPTSVDMIRLIGRCVRHEGRSPRFIISDHGAQFRNSFGRACEQRGIKHVRGKVGVWQLNAKIERFFRTLKAWQRRAWIAPNPRSVQRRLDAFCAWYNEYRLHSAHGLTPNEAAMQIERRTEPMTIRQKGDVEPTIRVTRQSVRGDPRLFYLDIDVRLKQKFAA